MLHISYSPVCYPPASLRRKCEKVTIGTVGGFLACAISVNLVEAKEREGVNEPMFRSFYTILDRNRTRRSLNRHPLNRFDV